MINSKQGPIIKAEATGDTSIKLTISGDIGDEWDGINSTDWEVINQNGISDATTAIDVDINTNGGSLTHGVAIYNFLKSHPAKIRTTVSGGAHSAGSVIFLAGDERIMPSGTTSLIHNPWSCGCGDFNETQKLSNSLKSFTEAMIDIYMERMTIDRDELVQMLDNEEILFGQKALDTGFATSLTAPVEALNADEIQNRAVIARQQVSASRACFLNKKDNEVIMSTDTTKRERPAKDESVELVQAKLDLANKDLGSATTEKETIQAKHDIVAARNLELTQEVATLKEELVQAKADTVDEDALRETIKEEVVAEISAVAGVKAKAASVGVKAEATTSEAIMQEVLAAKGVKNAESMTGEALEGVFAYVVDSASSEEADDVYASVADADSESEFTPKDKGGDMFASVNAKMKKGVK